MVQNVAACLVFDQPIRAHVTPLFVELHWLPIKFKSLMLAYKVLNGTAPIYLNALAKAYVIKGLSSSSAYTTLKTIQTLFMCRSTMVEWPSEFYKNWGIPVYLQETLEETWRSSSSESISYPSTYLVLPYPLYCTSDFRSLIVAVEAAVAATLKNPPILHSPHHPTN